MKAALLVAPERVVIEDVADPEIGPDDVGILVGGVGLCGSDGSVFSGKWKTPLLPWIMGHEAFGSIYAVGDRVTPSRVGESVVIEPNLACLACGQCARALTSACENRQSLGMNRPGALAERVAVPSRYAWPVAGMSAATLVCVEPLTVVEAALRRLDRALPASAMILGAGPQGLLMALSLMARGTRVHVQDLNPARAAFAGGLGAVTDDVAVGSFDLVVDTVGTPAASQSAVAYAAVGAIVLMLGLDDRPLGLTAQTVVRRQLQVRGSLTYDHPVDFATTIALLTRNEIEPSVIVGHEFPLEESQAALEQSPVAAGKTWVRVRST